ncbi:MAG: hypothetical protein WKF82_09365 [Nocardioidaceae bacterium]
MLFSGEVGTQLLFDGRQQRVRIGIGCRDLSRRRCTWRSVHCGLDAQLRCHPGRVVGCYRCLGLDDEVRLDQPVVL